MISLDENFQVENGVITAYTGNLTDVVIPSMVNGQMVTSLGQGLFEGNKTIKTVTIPSTIQRIEGFVFFGCSNLNTVNLCEGLTYIGLDAFAVCSSLTSITFPSTVKEIAQGAFYGNGLTSVVVPSTVATLGLGVFNSCSRLKEAVILASIPELPKETFMNCSSLTSVTLNSNYTVIGSSAFQGCSSLASITLPSALKTIEDIAFYDCSSLTELTVPSQVTFINHLAFGNCKKLSSIVLPKSLMKIGSSCFYNCSSLKHVYYGGSADDALFLAYPKTTNPYLQKATWNYTGSSTIPSTTDGTFEVRNGVITAYTGNSSDVVIPSTVGGQVVTSIGQAVFEGNTSIKTLTLPDTMQRIEAFAFFRCSNLHTVNLNEGLDYIGLDAFVSTTSLKTIDFPSTLRELDQGVFCESGLTSAVVPATVEKVGPGVFSSCKSLKEVVFLASIPELPREMFNSCTSLSSVTLASHYTAIGSSAFQNCSALTEITLPTQLETIWELAFDSCTGLKELTIPSKVSFIGHVTFSGCKNLNTIHLPLSVKEIGSVAFLNCSSLKTVYYGGTEKDRSYLAFPTTTNPYLEKATWIYSDYVEPTPEVPATPVYGISSTYSSNGTIKIGQSTASAGKRVTLEITANTGYFLENVLVKDGNGAEITVGYDWTTGEYAFVMPESAVTITANFAQVPDVFYDVELEASEGGDYSLSHQNPQEGDEVTITTKPSSGYSVSYVTVTNTSTGKKVQCNNNGGGSYSYKQPSSSVKVSVSYQYTEKAANTYTDVAQQDWYAAYVAYVTENGYMSGIGDGIFAPDEVTTRGMVALILALATGAELSAPSEQQFTDVPVNAWFASGIAWCKETGVMMGHENGSFGADDPVTQEQMATIFRSYARYLGQDADTLANELLLGYADCTQISAWAVDSFSWALGKQYFQGTGNLLKPSEGASRAEFANILNFFLENN